MTRFLGKFIAFTLAVLSVLPFAQLYLFPEHMPPSLGSFAALNFLGWMLLVLGVWWRSELRQLIELSAKRLGFADEDKLFERQLIEVLRAVDVKSQALSAKLMYEPLRSRAELARTLERVVQSGIELLEAESAEIILFDEGSGTPQSSFLVGQPFRSPLTIERGRTTNGQDPGQLDIITENIAFAGSILGVLRIGLGEGRKATIFHRDVVSILALQSGLAVVNAQYTKELLRMKSTSEESIKAKTGFLANLSHEIRGPLGIIANAVELVLDGLCGTVNEEQRETLAMVQSNGKHLLDLVNDVLDYARIESGQLQTTTIDIALEEFLAEIASVVRGMAAKKSHELLVDVTSTSLYVRSDRRHLRQILINLLTNAIKYTPEGGKIVLSASRVAQDRIRISVRDSGVGIEPSQHDKVFAPFERIEHSYSQKQVGAGLGLSLTKKLIEANNGLIDFDSSPGKGSEFWITLLASKRTERREEVVPLANDKKIDGNSDFVILWRGDEVETHLIEKYLLHCGFDVHRASHLDQLSQLSKDGIVKILIIDNHAADERNGQTLEELRRTTSAPILLISSKAFAFDVETYLKQGVDRCLFKPVELTEVARIVRLLIDSEKMHGTARGTDSRDGSKSSSQSRGKLIGVDDILH